LRILELKILYFPKSVTTSEKSGDKKMSETPTNTNEDFQVLEEGTDCGTRTGNVGKDGCGY